MRAPFAPPRLSDPLKVDADAHAVLTNSETLNPDDKTDALSASTSCSLINSCVTLGTGSCQIHSSAGTSFPK